MWFGPIMTWKAREGGWQFIRRLGHVRILVRGPRMGLIFSWGGFGASL